MISPSYLRPSTSPTTSTINSLENVFLLSKAIISTPRRSFSRKRYSSQQKYIDKDKDVIIPVEKSFTPSYNKEMDIAAKMKESLPYESQAFNDHIIYKEGCHTEKEIANFNVFTPKMSIKKEKESQLLLRLIHHYGKEKRYSVMRDRGNWSQSLTNQVDLSVRGSGKNSKNEFNGKESNENKLLQKAKSFNKSFYLLVKRHSSAQSSRQNLQQNNLGIKSERVSPDPKTLISQQCTCSSETEPFKVNHKETQELQQQQQQQQIIQASQQTIQLSQQTIQQSQQEIQQSQQAIQIDSQLEIVDEKSKQFEKDSSQDSLRRDYSHFINTSATKIEQGPQSEESMRWQNFNVNENVDLRALSEFNKNMEEIKLNSNKYFKFRRSYKTRSRQINSNSIGKEQDRYQLQIIGEQQSKYPLNASSIQRPFPHEQPLSCLSPINNSFTTNHLSPEKIVERVYQREKDNLIFKRPSSQDGTSLLLKLQMEEKFVSNLRMKNQSNFRNRKSFDQAQMRSIQSEQLYSKQSEVANQTFSLQQEKSIEEQNTLDGLCKQREVVARPNTVPEWSEFQQRRIQLFKQSLAFKQQKSSIPSIQFKENFSHNKQEYKSVCEFPSEVDKRGKNLQLVYSSTKKCRFTQKSLENINKLRKSSLPSQFSEEKCMKNLKDSSMKNNNQNNSHQNNNDNDNNNNNNIFGNQYFGIHKRHYSANASQKKNISFKTLNNFKTTRNQYSSLQTSRRQSEVRIKSTK